MRWGMRVAVALVVASCAMQASASTAPADESPTYSPATPQQPPPATPPPDATPPETTLDKTALRAATRSAKFWFSASEAAQGFLCQLDKGAFKPCGSPRAYKRLKPGRHAFRVKAVDLAGNVDGSAAVASFRVPRPEKRR